MTKTKSSSDRVARLAGICVGVALAAVALIAWRVPGGERTLGAEVRIEALKTGEVGVAPLHPFASKPSLLPGQSLSGQVTVRNQTDVPLALRLRALPSVRDLDALLAVRVTAGARTLFNGNLDGLRTGGTQSFTVAASTARRLHVTASLPAGLRTGFQGRILDVSLQVESRRAR
jgi:hypothetical protein